MDEIGIIVLSILFIGAGIYMLVKLCDTSDCIPFENETKD